MYTGIIIQYLINLKTYLVFEYLPKFLDGVTLVMLVSEMMCSSLRPLKALT